MSLFRKQMAWVGVHSLCVRNFDECSSSVDFYHNVTPFFKQNMPLRIKFEQAKQIWKCATVLSNFPDVADLHVLFLKPSGHGRLVAQTPELVEIFEAIEQKHIICYNVSVVSFAPMTSVCTSKYFFKPLT